MPLAEFTLERDGATTPVWHRVGDGSQWFLLLHGRGLDHRAMEGVVAGLPTHADALLPDLRGQGGSMLAPGVHAHFDDIVADCVALLDQVGAASVTVIGHSSGARLAQELAWLLPERVDRLVLIGCHDQHRHRTVGERTRVAAVSALARVVPWERFARLGARVGGHDRHLRDTIEQGLLRCGRDVFLDLERSASRTMHTVDGYEQPILLLAGEREYSRAFDRRYARIASRTPSASRSSRTPVTCATWNSPPRSPRPSPSSSRADARCVFAGLGLRARGRLIDRRDRLFREDHAMPAENPTTTTEDIDAEVRQITSLTAQLRRMDFSGGLWFGASIIAASIPIAALLSSGWRPSDLTGPEEAMWWFGSLLTLVSVCAFGWGGCPAYAFTPEIALRQKIYCMRTGVVLFIAGGTLSMFAVLVG